MLDWAACAKTVANKPTNLLVNVLVILFDQQKQNIFITKNNVKFSSRADNTAKSLKKQHQ